MKVVALETLQLAEFPFLFWLRIPTDAGLIGTGATFWANVVGHYARPDIFQLHVNERAMPPVVTD